MCEDSILNTALHDWTGEECSCHAHKKLRKDTIINIVGDQEDPDTEVIEDHNMSGGQPGVPRGAYADYAARTVRDKQEEIDEAIRTVFKEAPPRGYREQIATQTPPQDGLGLMAKIDADYLEERDPNANQEEGWEGYEDGLNVWNDYSEEDLEAPIDVGITHDSLTGELSIGLPQAEPAMAQEEDIHAPGGRLRMEIDPSSGQAPHGFGSYPAPTSTQMAQSPEVVAQMAQQQPTQVPEEARLRRFEEAERAGKAHKATIKKGYQSRGHPW